MSEEEKKLIETLKEKYNKSNKYFIYLGYDDIGKLFNFIEKQQKEIERKNKLIEKNRIALKDCLKYKSEEDYE